MERRRFTREFKLEAVRLIKERGVSFAQASHDLSVHQSQLRSWVKALAADPQHAFPGQGQMKPEQLEIAQLKREVIKLKAERDILREVLELVSGEAQKKRVIVRSDLRDEIPSVLANRIQLQQVMLNLITNAIEAMDLTTDSPRLLQVTSTLHSPSNVVIAVEDSGPGMDSNDVNRVFDPFFTTKPLTWLERRPAGPGSE